MAPFDCFSRLSIRAFLLPSRATAFVRRLPRGLAEAACEALVDSTGSCSAFQMRVIAVLRSVNLLTEVKPGSPFHTATKRASGQSCVPCASSSILLNRAAPGAVFCSASIRESNAVTSFSLLTVNVFILLLLPLFVVRTFITPVGAECKLTVASAPVSLCSIETVVEMGIICARFGFRRAGAGMMRTCFWPPRRNQKR